jgi:type I restriction enzyme S subunit
MAKKMELSLEKKLEQALVKKEEQLYELPDGWIWVKIGHITDVISGGTPKTKISEYYENGAVSWITPADLSNHDDVYISTGRRNITELGLQKSSAKLVPKNTVLMSSRAPIGYVAIAMNELSTNQGFKSFLPSDLFLPEYLYYYIVLNKKMINSLGSGTTFMELSGKKAKEIPFCLAPIDQQRVIVEIIKEQFEKLDRAKQLIQNVIDSFEDRKSAILHKAFTGELTKKWREKNGIGLDSWEEKTLDSVCESIFDGDHNAPPKSDSGIPFLVISNVNKGVLSFHNTRFVPQDYYKYLKETRKPRNGDVLYTIVGSYGIPVVVDTNQEFCFQRHMALLKPKYVRTKFLWYLLQSQEMYQKATEIATGTAQLTVPIRGLRKIQFNMPTISEQDEIIYTLNMLLNKEYEALQKYNVIKDIESLKKVILSKAFRGELTKNIKE